MEKQVCVLFPSLKAVFVSNRVPAHLAMDLILLTDLCTLEPQFRPLAAPPAATH